mgnify:FL=1
MTKDEFLNLKTASDMWKALVAHPELRVKECEAAFQKLREKEFEGRIIKREGSYNPDMHYDLNKKK